MKQEYKNALATKRKIAHAYLSLIKTHGENFSVTDLVNFAGINRGTFYLHFNNKQDVSHFIVENLAQNFNQLENAFRLYDIAQNPDIILDGLNKILLKDLDYYKLVIAASSGYNFIEYIKNIVLKLVSNNFKIMQYVFSIDRFTIAVKYIVSGGIEVYLSWLKGEMTCSLEDITKFLSKLIKDGLQGCLRYEG